MTPYEILLSESQERMLLVARAGREDAVRAIFARWDLEAAVIGQVTDDGIFRVALARPGGRARCRSTRADRRRARLSAPRRGAARLEEIQRLDPGTIPEPDDYTQTLLTLLESPNLCSREWVYRQYDQLVGGQTLRASGRRCRGRARRRARGSALALTVDCNSRYCLLDPYVGAVLRGGRGGAQLRRGRRAAARRQRLPQLRQPRAPGGDVGVPAGHRRHPRRLPRARHAGRERQRQLLQRDRGRRTFRRRRRSPWSACSTTSRRCTHAVVEGRGRRRSCCSAARARSSAAASTWRSSTASVRGAPPWIDLETEKRLHRVVLAAAQRAARCARRTTSREGGLAVALAECCFGRPAPRRPGRRSRAASGADALLFGESQSRMLRLAAPAPPGAAARARPPRGRAAARARRGARARAS